jgi:hypothetical protein
MSDLQKLLEEIDELCVCIRLNEKDKRLEDWQKISTMAAHALVIKDKAEEAAQWLAAHDVMTREQLEELCESLTLPDPARGYDGEDSQDEAWNKAIAAVLNRIRALTQGSQEPPEDHAEFKALSDAGLKAVRKDLDARRKGSPEAEGSGEFSPFSDPNCEHCAALDRTAHELDGDRAQHLYEHRQLTGHWPSCKNHPNPFDRFNWQRDPNDPNVYVADDRASEPKKCPQCSDAVLNENGMCRNCLTKFKLPDDGASPERAE